MPQSNRFIIVYFSVISRDGILLSWTDPCERDDHGVKSSLNSMPQSNKFIIVYFSVISRDGKFLSWTDPCERGDIEITSKQRTIFNLIRACALKGAH